MIYLIKNISILTFVSNQKYFRFQPIKIFIPTIFRHITFIIITFFSQLCYNFRLELKYLVKSLIFYISKMSYN